MAGSRRIAVPVRWRRAGGAALFPRMLSDVVFEAFGDAQTQMTLSGTYRPPGGELGRLIDRALLHAPADATVRDFTLRLAGHIERMVGARGTRRSGPANLS